MQHYEEKKIAYRMQEIVKITLPELNEICLLYERTISTDTWPFEELTV